MKKFTTKVQQVARRADEIRRVVEGVPPKIAEVREAVASTVAHVQKVRSELLTGLGTLRVESESQLMESLREIDSNVNVLHEAGCRVERVDLDLGPTRKLVVHLRRMEDRGADSLRALEQEHAGKATIRSLLAAVIKADELASGVELEALEYSRLTVDIGAYPSVRMGWQTSAGPEDVNPPARPTTAVAGESAPVFAQSNFFERRPAAGPAELQRESAPTRSEPTAASNLKQIEPAPAVKNAWGAESLDRFKKMPDMHAKRRT